MSKAITNDSIKTSAKNAVHWINNYRGIVFFMVLAVIYGFIIWRINVLSTAPPSEADAKSAKETTAASPTIDEASAKAIINLKDNSVRVQAIFDDARNNPFNE